MSAAYDALLTAEVELIAAVPDSILGPLYEEAARRREIRYVQACDEATAIAVACGATLAGTRALVMMENSGLRRGCETMSRFVLAHRLHTVLLLGHRGAFGEPNWWGIAHDRTMSVHLDMLNIPRIRSNSPADLAQHLRAAFDMRATGQCSVAVLATRAVWDG